MSDRQAFQELPFLDAYLRDILLPRVDRAVRLVALQLNESVWRQVIKILASEQPIGNEETEAMIRRVLEEQMGLVMEAKLAVRLAEGQVAPPRAVAEPPQVVVRPAALPLVNAMMSSPPSPPTGQSSPAAQQREKGR